MPTVKIVGKVQILEHEQRVLLKVPQLRVERSPVSIFGGPKEDALYDLTTAFDASILSGGGIAAVRVGAAIMIFGPDGQGIRIIGRRGQGPGEFQDPRILRLRGDTLLVVDRGNARISWALPSRGIIRSTSLFKRVPSLVGQPVAQLPGGQILLSSTNVWVAALSKGQRSRTSASIVLLPVRDTGRTILKLNDVQLAPFETSVGAKKVLIQEQVRLGLSVQIAAWDTLVATGDGSSYRIDLRNRYGRVLRAIEVSTPRRPITPAMRRASIAGELERFEPIAKSLPNPDEKRRLIREVPYADSLPAYSGFFPSHDGLLWVVDGNSLVDDWWAATAFRRDGAIVARLRGEGKARPIAFGNQQVLLRLTDEVGIVSFELHRILPAVN